MCNNKYNAYNIMSLHNYNTVEQFSHQKGWFSVNSSCLLIVFLLINMASFYMYITGARLEDYKVVIDGTPAQPINITEKKLTVRIPDSRPTGVTIVSKV